MHSETAANAVQNSLHVLGELCGHPVRLTVLDPSSRERVERVAGILAGVQSNGMTVDCLRPVPGLAGGAPVAVEVLVNGNLFWCHTTLQSVGGEAMDRLVLRTPASVQTLQRRRHPRVDLDVPVNLVLSRTGDAIRTTFRDLSAGGASLLTATPLSAGEPVQLVFSLGSGLFFQDLAAETVRCTDGPEGKYVVALRFKCDKVHEEALAAWVSGRLEAGGRA